MSYKKYSIKQVIADIDQNKSIFRRCKENSSGRNTRSNFSLIR